MLTADQLDSFYNSSVVQLYQDFEDSVIQDMAKRIVKFGTITSTTAWQAKRLMESAGLYEDILRKLSALTGKSEKELTILLKKMGITSMRFDDAIYKEVGLLPTPLHLSPAMNAVLVEGIRKTNGVMKNLTSTTAFTSQTNFISALDKAYLQVTSGTFSYDEAIRQAIKSVGASGLEITYPNGHHDKLDVSVRRATLTGVAQTTARLQDTRAQELGADLVQTSAHAGARPTHQVWQGKIFSRSGTSKKYPSFVEATGYGTMLGLCGINCRHSFYPFFEGISENAYTRAEVKDLNSQKVTYQGQSITQYEASQIQREIERKIRFWKRSAGALDAAGLDNVAESIKVREWQQRMRDFISSTDLQRQSVREQVQ